MVPRDPASSQSPPTAAAETSWSRYDTEESSESPTLYEVDIFRLSTPSPDSGASGGQQSSSASSECDERKHDDDDVGIPSATEDLECDQGVGTSSASVHQSIPSATERSDKNREEHIRRPSFRGRGHARIRSPPLGGWPRPRRRPPLALSKPTQVNRVKPPAKHNARALERAQQSKRDNGGANGEPQQTTRNRFGWQSPPRTAVGAHGKANRNKPPITHTTNGGTYARTQQQPPANGDKSVIVHTPSGAKLKLKTNLKQPKPLKSKTPRVLLDGLNNREREQADSALKSGSRNPPRLIPVRARGEHALRPLRPAAAADRWNAETIPEQKSDVPTQVHAQRRPAPVIVPKRTLPKPQTSPAVAKPPIGTPIHPAQTSPPVAKPPIGTPIRPAPLPRKNRRSTLSLSPRRKTTRKATGDSHEDAAAEDATKGEHKQAPEDAAKSNIKSPRIRLMSTFNAYSHHSPPHRRYRQHCANVLCDRRETDWDVFPLCAKCDTRYCTQLCAHIDRYRHKDECRTRSFGAGVCGGVGGGCPRRLEPEVAAPPSDKYNFSSRAKKIISQRLSDYYAHDV